MRQEIHEDDFVIKMGSSAFNFIGDWLKEWDSKKCLAKVVKILEQEFPMISYMHQY